jgi:heat shock protein HslJ
MKSKNLLPIIPGFLIALLCLSCGGSFLLQKTAEFENKVWLIQSIDYNDIPNGEGKIYLKFVRDGNKLTGYGGCNNIVGSYSITASDIKIKPSLSKESCPGEMETEKQLILVLEKATEFREFTSSDKDYLRLMTADGSSIELRKK